MARRRAVRLALVGAAALVVTLLAGVAVLTTVLVRRPFPQTGGEADVSGLQAPVTVMRDARGVPSLFADSAEDLFRAQGFVQAQDRFFEMDWRRHVTAGRLSELVGADPDALLADKVVRTLGWRRVAEQELAQAAPATRTYLEAYAAGVNDYLASRTPSQLSFQYTVLGLSVDLPAVEPWTPVDSLAWFKAMAWDLRGNYDAELERAGVFAKVRDVRRVEQLFPDFPYGRNPTILTADDVRTGAPRALGNGADAHVSGRSTRGPDGQGARGASMAGVLAAGGADALARTRRVVGSAPDLLGTGEGIGSNAWAVAGRLTATGKPLLANDPHLAPGLPGIWYQMGLHCRQVTSRCPFDVAGFTFAGVPGVVIGHTRHLAWGMTNLGPDVTDFYLEKIRGDTVERDGATQPLDVRTETIAVAGGDPVPLRIRSTVHGPLLSDVLTSVSDVARELGGAGGGGYAVSLAWTALQPGHDMDAVFAVDTATDFASFRAGVLLMDAPAQNFVYADDLGDHGHVGYAVPGRIPVRAQVPSSAGADPGADVPTDGTWPLPGWDSRYDWAGFLAPAKLPWSLDPASGLVVTANQPVTPRGPGPYLGDDFDYGWRAQRIGDLLRTRTASGRLVTTSDMEAVQRDTRNPLAATLVPVLLAAKVDPFTAEGRDLLRGWDGDQPPASGAAVYFNAVWARLLRLAFADEMPAGAGPSGGGRWVQVVLDLLDRPKDPWWDDRSTPDVVETRDEIVRRSLVEARLELTRTQGKDPELWSWGQAHTLDLRLTPLGQVSATRPLHRLLNARVQHLGGGAAVPDALGYDASSGSYEVTSAPSMRMVVDLADPDASRWVNQTGQSGHPGSTHYLDQLGAWATGRSYPWAFTAAGVRAAARDTLTLSPPK